MTPTARHPMKRSRNTSSPCQTTARIACVSIRTIVVPVSEPRLNHRTARNERDLDGDALHEVSELGELACAVPHTFRSRQILPDVLRQRTDAAGVAELCPSNEVAHLGEGDTDGVERVVDQH